MRPDMSIIIPHLNGIDLLKDCLESIERNMKKNLRKEVVIIFNGSQDGSDEMCAKLYPWVKRIRNEVNKGFNFANNQGIGASTGRFIMLLNNDTIVLPHAFENMINYLSIHDDVGMVGPKLIYPDGKLQRACNHLPNLRQLILNTFSFHRLFPKNRYLATLNMTYWDYNETRPVHSISGSCMLIRREAISEVGLLDSRTPVAGDYDLCWRFWKSGWKIVFIHDAVIVHRLGQSSLNPVDKDINNRINTKLLNIRALYNFFRDNRTKEYAVMAILIIKMEALLKLPIIIISFFFASSMNRWASKADILFCLSLLRNSFKSFERDYTPHPFV